MEFKMGKEGLVPGSGVMLPAAGLLIFRRKRQSYLKREVKNDYEMIANHFLGLRNVTRAITLRLGPY